MSRSNREELLRAAWAVIAERGVYGLRVEDVAEAVGVTKSLAYYHFKSRAGLLAATLDYNEGLSPTAVLKTAKGNGFERLRTAAVAEFESSKKIRMNHIVWHEINAAATFDEELRDRVRTMTRRWVDEFADAVREGQRDGSIHAGVDPDSAASALTALLAGFIERVLVDESVRVQARGVVNQWVGDHLRAPSVKPARSR
ncbi:MAG: TetR/AcrR family transcriptional regulator [Mycobacterium sp.]